MQVTNYYCVNYQPNFRSITIMKPLREAIEKGAISTKRKLQINKFINKYKNSEVTVILDKADEFGDRLDAQVFYGNPRSNWQKETFGWFCERKLSNLFGISPKKFLKFIGRKVKSIEAYKKHVDAQPRLKAFLEGEEKGGEQYSVYTQSFSEFLAYAPNRFANFVKDKIKSGKDLILRHKTKPELK